MSDNTESRENKRNNSNLAPADCYNRLTNENYAFESMSNDDLDSIYYIAFERWAYHLTRQGYIDALYAKRNELYNQRDAIITDEKKPFLSEEDADQATNEMIWEYFGQKRAFKQGFNAAAEKANAKIASLQDAVENLRSLLINAEQRGEDKANARINDERQKLKSKVERLEIERDELWSLWEALAEAGQISIGQGFNKKYEQFKASRK